jgi:tRNA-binding EMAP/Myf-like protein
MPVIHKVAKSDYHPNADRLRLYTMIDSDGTERQIVANLTNIYQVGDHVNVVIPGEEFEGSIMKETTIRGVLSQGMAIGKV